MEQDIKQRVANNLVALRKSKDLTQQDVARILNYSDKSVSKWEHADSLPDISILSAMCDMYGVTLDFLIRADAGAEIKTLREKDQKQTAAETSNRIIIILMSIVAVYLVASVIFVYSTYYDGTQPVWQAFIWAIPVCCLFLLYYNRKWFKRKILSVVFLSVLTWSALLSAFLQFLPMTPWLLFILGIPVQIIILLATQLTKNGGKK